MSMLMMAKAFGIKVGNANRKLVLLKLADNANDQGECFPSYQHIADQCEMGRSTVKNHIKALEDAGYLIIQERKLKTHQSSNVYKLTLDNGKIIEREKPKRPGKSKGSTADPGQPLTGGGSTADRGRSTADLPPRSTADPITCHSFESVSEPVNEPLQAGNKSPSDPGKEVSASRPRVSIPDDMPGPKDQTAKTFRPWANYAMTYHRRYGAWPIWNARVAGQMGQLVDRVGKDLAPAVAAYYLTCNNQYYVTKGHPVGLMLQDCETLATQAQTGRQMTASRARQIDSTQTSLNSLDEAKRMVLDNWGDD